MTTPRTNSHNQWLHQIWIFGSSHVKNLKSQQKHALRNRFLRKLLCSNDLFIPGYNRKMLIRKNISILEGVCFNYEQLFLPVQCTACKICRCSSTDKLVLPEVTVILSISDKLHYLWGIISFGNGKRQYSTSLYQSESSHILFAYHYILSILGKIFILWNKVFQGLAIVAFQL